jgi:hypothetical protein
MMRLNSGKERLCYALSLSDVDTPLRAHIHRGEAGVNGGIEVFFFDLAIEPPIPVPDGMADCVSVPRELVKEIRSNPAGFYVNVHNEPFPGGAVRGQLERGSDDDGSDDEASDDSDDESSSDGLGGKKLSAALTGDAEVGGGDPDGNGEVQLRLNSGQERICYTMVLNDIEPATRAHIHRGDAGTNGGIEVFLFDVTVDPPLPVPDSLAVPTCVDVARDLVKEIRHNPSGFYVNVHNSEYPGGAVRGQLHGGSDDDDSSDDGSDD